MGLTTAGRKRPEIEWKRIMKPLENITLNDKNLFKQRYSWSMHQARSSSQILTDKRSA
jgi:hypothetical protein